MHSVDSDHHITALASIFGGLTEYLFSSHVTTALLVAIVSGGGAKLGGYLMGAVLDRFKGRPYNPPRHDAKDKDKS
jgi:hypothetical protein